MLGLATGLEILRDDCKVMLPKWLPYQTMLPPLAAVLARAGSPKTAEAGAQREKLKRWFWCAVFGQAYESAPNSKSAKDVVEILPWLAGGDAAGVSRVIPLRPAGAARRDAASARDLSRRDLPDPRRRRARLPHAGRDHRQAHGRGGDRRPPRLPGRVPGDDEASRSARTRDCVLNRTLIDRTTNQMISDRAPSDYLAEIRNTPGFPFDAVLASHGLPTGADSPLLERRLRGVPRLAARPPVAGDPARHGSYGGRGPRGRR